MAVKQLSVFVPNIPGALVPITDTLAAAGIDLKSFSVADTERFGILRIIADDPMKAVKLLSDGGYTAGVTEVVASAADDQVGGLNRLLRVLAEAEINIEYMYSIINSERGKAYMVIRVDDNDRAEKALRDHGFPVLCEDDLLCRPT